MKRNSDRSVVLAIRNLLDALSDRFGISLQDPNFRDTPRRVAAAYDELLGGYKEDSAKILKTDFPGDEYDQMIIVKDIDFFSLCAHHMLPFYGKIAVGYIPGSTDKLMDKRRVVGLSKIPRICQMYAQRFQIQERMTMQIANAINHIIKPVGVGVVISDSTHLCARMRGVKSHNCSMTTSAMLGEFRNDASVRAEFLKLIEK